MPRKFLVNGALAAVAVGAGVASYMVVGANSASTHTSETLSTAKTGIVLSSVTSTGNVEAPTSLGVNFQQSGTVTEIDVAPGQHVDTGQVLAKVDDTTQRGALVTAQAQLASAQAALAQKIQGATPEALAQDAVGLAQSQLSVGNAQDGLAHAQQTAAGNALKYQQGVDQASAQLAAAQQTAADNVPKYQQAVDQATAQLASAQQTATDNLTKYQQAVEQAQQQLDAANQQLSTANTNLSEDQSALQQLQTSYDPSASSSPDANSALNRYRVDQSDCQSGDPKNPPTNAPDGVDCAHVGDLISFTQNVIAAQNAQTQASSAVDAAQRGVDSAKLAQTDGQVQDQQAIATAQRGIDAAKLAQTNGLQQDQQTVATAQRGLDTAKLGQSNGLVADAQAIDTASNAINTAQAALESTQAGNAVKEAPATPDVLAAARATVSSADAALVTAQRNEDETSLTAPVAGTVASVSGQVGSPASGSSSSSSSSGSSGSGSSGSGASSGSSSSASSTSGFVVLTDVNLLDVKVGFAEADAAKVRVGQAATVTFDALPGQTVNGTVLSIDVNQTLVSNVVTYYAHIGLTSPPADIKPGMTASVSVVLDKRENVVTLPTSAVSTRGNTATVTVRDNAGKDSTRTIAVGLRGDNAVEIVSGLQAGETVVTKVTSATGTGTSNFGGRGGGGGGVVVGGPGGGTFGN
ncbi:MAG TPA: HlyD family efflux transporter periplasmic adaptor subunit [Acidimicrobiales bacterium]|nr:HlyD family efflux transporter periplasmic adaptor subunit [Acidimicrobiales bacterium]